MFFRVGRPASMQLRSVLQEAPPTASVLPGHLFNHEGVDDDVSGNKCL